MRKTRFLLFAILSTFLILPYGIDARILHVDDDGVQFSNADYTDIQDAIDVAEAGDEISIYPGEYGAITVDKQLVIRGVRAGDEFPIIDAQKKGSAVILNADGIVFNGFTVINASLWPEAGIKITSNDNIISNCNIMDNGYYGVFIYYSASNNTLLQCRIENNYYGIATYYSKENRIISNALKNNFYAIYLSTYSNNNFLKDNMVADNDYGIFLESSSNNILRNNNILNNRYNFGVWGRNEEDFINDVDSGNSVNGKKIFYLIKASDMILSDETGLFYCISCKNITVKNLKISNNLNGIHFYNTTDSRIMESYITDTWYGIRFQKCKNNTIERNNLSRNDFGIYMYSSSGNVIYLNNFINNKQDVYSYNSENRWSSLSEIPYTYNSKHFLNYMGNYWEEDLLKDVNGDGIADSPYPVYQESDNYPLVDNFKSYFQKFDTEAKDGRESKISDGAGGGVRGRSSGTGSIISIPVTSTTSPREESSEPSNSSIQVATSIKTPPVIEQHAQRESSPEEPEREKIADKEIQVEELRQQPTGLIIAVISLFAVLSLILYLARK